MIQIKDSPSINKVQIDKPIVLIGIMGVGKSTTGRKLANMLSLPFYDTDKEIEKKCYCSVADIFYYAGESYFRDYEVRIIEELLNREKAVIATGEGTFVIPAARELIKERAISVWVSANNDVVSKRITHLNTRPLLENKDKDVILAKFVKEREHIYAQANVSVDSSYKSRNKTVNDIIEALKAENFL